MQLEKVSTRRSGPLIQQLTGLGNVTLRLEVSHAPSYGTEIVTLARDADKDNKHSSFAMLVTDAPHLNGQYTPFVKFTSGVEVLFQVEDVNMELVGAKMALTQWLYIISSYCFTTVEDEATCDFAAMVVSAGWNENGAECWFS